MEGSSTLTELQALVLAVLRDEGRSHGHAVRRVIEDRLGKRTGAGTLYKTLHSLERQGFAKGEWENQPEAEYGRPRRRFYSITGLGERALKDYITQIESTHRVLKGVSRGAQA